MLVWEVSKRNCFIIQIGYVLIYHGKLSFLTLEQISFIQFKRQLCA